MIRKQDKKVRGKTKMRLIFVPPSPLTLMTSYSAAGLPQLSRPCQAHTQYTRQYTFHCFFSSNSPSYFHFRLSRLLWVFFFAGHFFFRSHRFSCFSWNFLHLGNDNYFILSLRHSTNMLYTFCATLYQRFQLTRLWLIGKFQNSDNFLAKSWKILKCKLKSVKCIIWRTTTYMWNIFWPGDIPDICHFLYTNAFFRPVKSPPKKCVNSRQ